MSQVADERMPQRRLEQQGKDKAVQRAPQMGVVVDVVSSPPAQVLFVPDANTTADTAPEAPIDT